MANKQYRQGSILRLTAWRRRGSVWSGWPTATILGSEASKRGAGGLFVMTAIRRPK